MSLTCSLCKDLHCGSHLSTSSIINFGMGFCRPKSLTVLSLDKAHSSAIAIPSGTIAWLERYFMSLSLARKQSGAHEPPKAARRRV